MADTTEVEPLNDKPEPAPANESPNNEPKDQQVLEDEGEEVMEEGEPEPESSPESVRMSTNSQEGQPKTPDPALEGQQSKETDVEALQKRLKQVEQRFAGLPFSSVPHKFGS